MGQTSRLIFEGRIISIGEWRCYPNDRLWDEENVTGPRPMVVFPRSAVQIQHSGQDLFVTSPNQVVFYNRRQTYRRALASQRGDICEYVYVDPKVVAEMIASVGAKETENLDALFSTSFGPCHSHAFLTLRSICKLLSLGKAEPLIIEEAVLGILPQLIRDANPNLNSAPTKLKAKTDRKHRDQVEWIKEFLAKNIAATITLNDVAEVSDSSVFHISRVFKSIVGTSIFRYLMSLRLRTAFEYIVDTKLTMTHIAMETGFSNQSHLANLFKREFGLTPSQARKQGYQDIVNRLSHF